jgi:hypothetical protein
VIRVNSATRLSETVSSYLNDKGKLLNSLMGCITTFLRRIVEVTMLFEMLKRFLLYLLCYVRVNGQSVCSSSLYSSHSLTVWSTVRLELYDLRIQYFR